MQLDDLGFVGRGKSKHRPRNDPTLYGGEYPFVQTGDVKEADLWLTRYRQTYNQAGLGQSKLWPVGTLCITIAANIAETAILKIPACFPDSIVGFIPHPGKADARYVKYYIDTIKLRMQNASKGTTQDNLSVDKLLSFDFQVPSYQTQERIASILSAYDDLIENNARRVKILDEMASMIFREWFVNFRVPSYDKVRIMQSDVGRIPVAWTTEPLENICQRITDGSHWSPTTIESTYRMASSKDMRRWGLDLSECRTISKEDYDNLIRNDCRPLAGDVLITKDGANYLKYCFAVEKDLDVVLLSSVAMLRPREQALSTYLSLYLRDPSVKSRLSGRVSGAAIPRIVLTDFRRFKIMLPDLVIVRMFHDVVDPIVKLCCRLTECNQNLRRTRDFMLPKLVSGEVNVEQIEAEAVSQGV
jgi:type I restriction enzyme S subunit